MPGRGVQVVHVEGNRYRLDDELERILLRDDIKDLPVAVVSVAGASRCGKSILLNFFLRYLSASETKRQDGSWIGTDNTELEGFVWRVGIIKTTSGIVMWSEPFIVTLGNGERVAVLLMDTEGTFDGLSNSRDSTTIFGLSSLLSSLQIYNIKMSIGDEQFQNLKLITEYGKLSHDQGTKALQDIEFLVRDWTSANELEYGSDCGKLYLEEKLRMHPDQVEEMQTLREQIRCSYKSVSCFLLPSPGVEAISDTFNGKNENIDIEFKTYIKQLTANLLGPNQLKPKQVNGLPLTASELLEYVSTYIDMFNREVPTAADILQATANATMNVAFDEGLLLYRTGMKAECRPGGPCVHPHDLEEHHACHRAEALAFYNSKRNINSRCDLRRLNEAINQSFDQIKTVNRDNSSRALQAGITAYDEYMSSAWDPHKVCLHPADLAREHTHGERRALTAFRGHPVTSTMFSFDSTEEFENRLFDVLRSQLAIIKRNNDTANEAAVDAAFERFVFVMENSSSSYVQLLSIPELVNYCMAPFLQTSKRVAHETFYARRRDCNNPARDIYLEKLDSRIKGRNFPTLALTAG